MTRHLVDKPTKHKPEAVETEQPAGRCDACRSWLYFRDGTHVCISTNGGPSIPQPPQRRR